MDKVKCKVVGPRPVAGVTQGGTVELDPERYNVDALVAAGHVEVAKPKAGPKAADSEAAG